MLRPQAYSTQPTPTNTVVALTQSLIWYFKRSRPSSGDTTVSADPATQGAREGRGDPCGCGNLKKIFTTYLYFLYAMHRRAYGRSTIYLFIGKVLRVQ